MPTLVDIESADGSRFADLLTRNGVANTLRGAAGNDILRGLGGRNLLYSASGNEALSGGTAFDSAPAAHDATVPPPASDVPRFLSFTSIPTTPRNWP
ncbi:hypothetical protein [Nocardioides speluncae]|uniref:hypothetical protein n=1 Tax=Nocardioides speluncae TaxID=2670337 RepID=UPI000D68BDEF|nr:hypothetical protein [Nocardioides speluncae]